MTESLPKCVLRPSNTSSWAPPLDVRDLVVRLEADGITSPVCRAKYGFEDVWDMAEAYFPLAEAQAPIEPAEKDKPRKYGNYLKGLYFAAPLVCCCLTVLLFKVALWGGSLSGNEAAAIAIATISSFAVTGGFIQIIGRQGHFYKSAGEWRQCAQCCWRFNKAGIVALLIFIGTGFLANQYFGWLPLPLFAWCAAFHFAIGSYLLVSGILYVVNGELLVALGTLVGTAIVLALRFELQLPLLLCQIIGILTATIACTCFAAMRFRKFGSHAGKPLPLPSPGRLIYGLWPYFAYGCAYYLFLFIDRIIAWSAATQYASLPFQFRGDYETALDMCLLAFILQVGWIHAGLIAFYDVVTNAQKQIRLTARRELERLIRAFYGKQLLTFLMLFVISSALVVVIIGQIHSLKVLLNYRVALLGLAGTPFLAIGLWNISVLFALSRPRLVLIAIGWALLLDICVGYLLSRLYSYDLAIVGFAVGAFALASVSGWFCKRLVTNFDYHYFAASV